METYIDIEQTKNIANQMINYVSSLEDNLKQLISIIDRIDDAWDGDDSLKYINTMKDKCIIEFQKLNDIVQKYGEFLLNAPDAYSILDETFSSQRINI